MASTYISPFDLRKIFLELFLGSTELFVFAFLIVFSFVCAKFGMSNKVFMLLLTLSAIIFATILEEAVYLFVIILVGYIAFKSITKLIIQ